MKLKNIITEISDNMLEKLINSDSKFDIMFPGKSSANGWKLSIQGKTINDVLEVAGLLHSWLTSNNIAHKIATKKRIYHSNFEQARKIMTIYVPNDTDHLSLAEEVYKKLKSYKGWHNIKTPKSYEHYAGGVFFRNDRDQGGNYIPARS